MKTLVIGIDAASWEIINPLLKKGKLPNIQKLLQSGILASLKSTYPPLTPPAWNTMITGVNPGKHGLMDFLELDVRTYAVKPVSSNSLRVKTIWEILNGNGYKVGVVNFPASYPPPKVESFFISGFSSPEEGVYAQPPKLMEYLKKKNYRIYPRFSYKKGREKKYFEEVKELTDIQSEVALELMKREEWDLFFVVFMGVDWIQHYLWDYEISPGTNAVEYFYEYLDGKIGMFLEYVQKDDYVLIVSDHGMKEIRGEIHTNTLLEQWGYLQRKSNIKYKIANLILNPVKSLPFNLKMLIKGIIPKSYTKKISEFQDFRYLAPTEIDWKNTKVFSYGSMGKIYLHTKNKYPHGVIKSEDNNAIKEEIISRLKELKHPETSEKVIGEIFTKEEVYGVDSDTCPDIIFTPRDFEYTVHNDFGENWIGPSRHRKADHSLEGVIILNGYGTGVLEKFKIEDIAPTILSMFNIDIPGYMEGKSALEINTKKSEGHFDIPEKKSKDIKSKDIYSKKEEEDIKKRLEGLGYL